jgi:hypothetical protein
VQFGFHHSLGVNMYGINDICCSSMDFYALFIFSNKAAEKTKVLYKFPCVCCVHVQLKLPKHLFCLFDEYDDLYDGSSWEL